MTNTTLDALCDDWSEKGIDLCRFIHNARNESVRMLRVVCSGVHVASAADRIITIRGLQLAADSANGGEVVS